MAFQMNVPWPIVKKPAEEKPSHSISPLSLATICVSYPFTVVSVKKSAAPFMRSIPTNKKCLYVGLWNSMLASKSKAAKGILLHVFREMMVQAIDHFIYRSILEVRRVYCDPSVMSRISALPSQYLFSSVKSAGSVQEDSSATLESPANVESGQPTLFEVTAKRLSILLAELAMHPMQVVLLRTLAHYEEGPSSPKDNKSGTPIVSMEAMRQMSAHFDGSSWFLAGMEMKLLFHLVNYIGDIATLYSKTNADISNALIKSTMWCISSPISSCGELISLRSNVPGLIDSDVLTYKLFSSLVTPWYIASSGLGVGLCTVACFGDIDNTILIATREN